MEKKILPQVRIELTTSRLLCLYIYSDYETDALPTALLRLYDYYESIYCLCKLEHKPVFSV